MTTLVFTHPSSLLHVTPPGHVERVDRIRAVNAILDSQHFAGLMRRDAPRGSEAHILLAHAREHLDRVVGAAPDHGF